MMVQKIVRVLILEDRLQDAKEIKQFISSPFCEVVLVSTAEAAIQNLSNGFDCYVFDINIPGAIKGHDILLKGIKSGDIRVPCIIITGEPIIKTIEEEYGDIFMAFINKRISGWVKLLDATIMDVVKIDVRQHYMTYHFKKRNALSLEIKMKDDWGFGDNNIILSDAIALLGSANLAEEVKNMIYDQLVYKLGTM